MVDVDAVENVVCNRENKISKNPFILLILHKYVYIIFTNRYITQFNYDLFSETNLDNKMKNIFV